MRVALLDVDSVIPNLALMKISQWHKMQGDTVLWYDELWRDTYDEIYASAVFEYSDKSIIDPERMQVGGTGWDTNKNLPGEIHSVQPDYSLYGYPHNIGFTMRGCRFRCKFCVVPVKEGKPYEEHSISDIWQQRDSDFVMLLDNDFFGNPSWRERIDEILAHDLCVNFSQGLNIRIITEEQAQALASVKFVNGKRTLRQVFFAWDQFGKGTERLIDQGIERVTSAGVKPYQMAFFVLIGFNTTQEQDLYRVEKLRDLGCDPYAMPYNKSDPYQKKFCRWVNRKQLLMTIPFADYARSRHDRPDKRTGELFDARGAA